LLSHCNHTRLSANSSFGRQDRISIPDAHVGAGDRGQADGARETLVTLRVIVLQADLKLNGLEEVALLLLVGVLQELGDLRPDISWQWVLV
jgi:hypothetical protein